MSGAPALAGGAPGSTSRQPRGLALLFFAEMWERFSYYGMRALLVLYLIDSTTGGYGWTQERASRLYGWYTGMVWLTPIAGGWLADRFLGSARAVAIGAAIIALGHFSLAVEAPPFFFGGLVLVVLGTGFFKSNVSTLVGQLYAENDPRRDAGFTIFYMGINLGGFLGPLVCGWLASNPAFGWRWGFGAAGVGMLCGLATFLLLRGRLLGEIGHAPVRREPGTPAAAAAAVTPEERDRMLAIGIVSFFVIFFWLAFEQAGSSLNVFAQERIDRTVTGPFAALVPNGQVPASWFQSINSFWIIALAPLLAMVWQWLGARQPSTPAKMVIGLVLIATGFAVILPASLASDHGGLGNAWWLVLLYAFHSAGELCLSPVGLSFVTKMAPARFAAMMMGVWFLSNFAANLAGGYVAGLVQRVARGEFYQLLGGQSDFFLLFIASSLLAAVTLALLVPTVKRLMHGRG